MSGLSSGSQRNKVDGTSDIKVINTSPSGEKFDMECSGSLPVSLPPTPKEKDKRVWRIKEKKKERSKRR